MSLRSEVLWISVHTHKTAFPISSQWLVVILVTPLDPVAAKWPVRDAAKTIKIMMIYWLNKSRNQVCLMAIAWWWPSIRRSAGAFDGRAYQLSVRWQSVRVVSEKRESSWMLAVRHDGTAIENSLKFRQFFLAFFWDQNLTSNSLKLFSLVRRRSSLPKSNNASLFSRMARCDCIVVDYYY